MDFDSMKQINMNDMSKKRNIKRIEIPENLRGSAASNIIDYLRNDLLVLGVSGKKF